MKTKELTGQQQLIVRQNGGCIFFSNPSGIKNNYLKFDKLKRGFITQPYIVRKRFVVLLLKMASYFKIPISGHHGGESWLQNM